MLSGDDQTTIGHELENIPTAVVATFNEDNEDDNESEDDSVIPDVKDFEFEKEEKEMEKPEEPKEKGIMDDMPSETGGDCKQLVDSKEFAERYTEAHPTGSEGTKDPTIFAVSQKVVDQKPGTTPVVDKTAEPTGEKKKRSYIRRKPKTETEPIEIPTDPRGLILKMVKIGEKEARDKGENLELFGKRVDSFSWTECEAIEVLLYEASQNDSLEHPHGVHGFIHGYKSVKLFLGKSYLSFCQKITGVRISKRALFENLTSKKGKGAIVVPIPLAFARSQNLFPEEFLKPIEPETPAPPEPDASEPLDEGQEAPDYLGKPQKISIDSFVQAFSETVLADPDLLPGAIILCDMLKSFPKATRGLEMVLDFLDKVGKLSDAEEVAEKARQELYKNPIIRALSGKLGF